MNILFVSLGCDKNLVDTEVMLGLLAKNGHQMVDSEEFADVNLGYYKKGGKLTINDSNGVYDFKLLASNGVVLCSSSEYKTKSPCLNSWGLISSERKYLTDFPPV